MTFKWRTPAARRQIVRNEIIEMIYHWHQGGSALRELATPWVLTGIRSASTCGWPKSEEKGGFIYHDLRHTFITEMRRAGVNQNVTNAITGHAIINMNQRYDMVEDWEKTQAIKTPEAYRHNEAAKVDQAVDQNIPEVSNVLKLHK